MLTNIGAFLFIAWLSTASQATHEEMTRTVEAQHESIEALFQQIDEAQEELRIEERAYGQQADRATRAESRVEQLEAKLAALLKPQQALLLPHD